MLVAGAGSAGGGGMGEAPGAPAAPQAGSGPTINMGMPDPKRISGIPLPAPDVPAGSVRVRVVRDEITSFVLGAPVVLEGPGDRRSGKTDQTGHVQFDKLKAGTTYKLSATVDGKKVESRPFQAPSGSGLKFMLVGAAAGQPPGGEEAEEEGGGEGGAGEGGGDLPLNPLRGAPVQPDAKVPPGVVEVRLVGADGKPMSGQKVILVSANREKQVTQREATSGPDGKARFDKVAAVAELGYLVAMRYENMTINSAPFKMVEKPGMAVELKVFRPTHEASQLVLANQSHIAIELGDEALSVIENLVLENRGEATYDPGPAGLFFPLPEGFTSAQGAEDAPSQFQIAEKKGVYWKGPVPPGRMTLRFGFVLPIAGPEYAFHQSFPMPLEGPRIFIERDEKMEVEGPTAKAREERTFNGRKYFLVGSDDRLPAGAAIDLTLRNLPLTEKTGAYLALAASILVAGWGFVMTRGHARAQNGEKRKKLEERRERLLGELVSVEELGRSGRMDPTRHKARREELVSGLERVYRELDAEELG